MGFLKLSEKEAKTLRDGVHAKGGIDRLIAALSPSPANHITIIPRRNEFKLRVDGRLQSRGGKAKTATLNAASVEAALKSALEGNIKTLKIISEISGAVSNLKLGQPLGELKIDVLKDKIHRDGEEIDYSIIFPLSDVKSSLVDNKNFANYVGNLLKAKGQFNNGVALALDALSPVFEELGTGNETITAKFADAVSSLGSLIDQASTNAKPTTQTQPALALPSKAPEIYAQRTVRADLGRKENPIEFLNRVWGAYIEAGVLFQDDIKRLGDDKLVQAVRGRCRDTNTDAGTILPPPRQAKVDQLLSSNNPKVVQKLAAERLKARRRNVRYRERQSQTMAPK